MFGRVGVFMKNSVKKNNGSKYTEDWLPIRNITNGAIILENKVKVTGVKIRPRNIFILDKNQNSREILKLTDIKEKERYRDKCLQENYILLSKIYGQPPISFNFNYKDINKNEFQHNDITPKEFLEICFPNDMNDYIFVMNNNKYPFYKEYLYNDFTQIYNNNHYFYNLPINDIKQAIIKQLKDGCPIWFGSDFRAVCGTSLNKVGILDCNLIDLKNSLGIEILSKIEQEKFNSNNYNHAMIIVGVQIEDNKTIRWKVQNSYGEESNQNDNFFEEYAVMFGINKKYIEQLNI